MNLGGLAGLSAAYPAYVKGRVSEDQADLEDFKVSDAKRQALAKVAMGNALAMLSQGGQQGPQAPPPGQGSQPMMQPPPGGGMPPGGPSAQPMIPPQGMPQQRPPMGPGGQMPPPGGQPAMGPGGPPGMQQGGQPPGGMQQRGQGALDWRQLVAAVKQANPNLPPDVMAEAVNQFLPLMNQQSQMEWKQISLQLREQSLQQRESQFMMAEQGRNQRMDTAEGGRQQRAADKEKGVEGRFQQREQRLGDALKFREDSTYQRLEMQKQQAEQRVQAAQGKQGLGELKAIIDAQDKHVRTRIMAYSAANTLKPEERKKLLDQADADYKNQIERLRAMYGRSTPGGASAKPGVAKVEDRAPVGTSNPAGGTIPPEAAKQLKEGQITTFGNGQKWTLKNGQPEQVP